jgi:putative transposase
MEIFFRRNLPHWQPSGVPFFLTYRLNDTLPKRVIQELEREKAFLQKQSRDSQYSEKEWQIHLNKRIFARWDEYLDRSTHVRWLADPRVAELVRNSLYYHTQTKYTLWAYVIMPNHVHVLLKPMEHFEKQFIAGGENDNQTSHLPDDTPSGRLMYKGPIPAILHALRSYTANQANKVLGRTGKFWDHEVYDHWVRDNDEFARIVAYIEQNPVKAGLVSQPDDWRFSSAYDRAQMGIGPFDELA